MINSKSLVLLVIFIAFTAMVAGTCSASLQQAVDESVDGCIIVMRAGTWNENVAINNDLTIFGGYGGGETVISGVPAGYGTGDGYGISESPVLTINYADVVLTGLTITNGNVINYRYGGVTPGTTGGGGILNTGGTLTLNDVTIAGNRATFGGGIYNDHGTVILNRGTSIAENSAGFTASGEYGTSNLGGGIYNDHGTVILNRGSSISHNVASAGAGIYNNGGTVNLHGGIVSGNIPDQIHNT